MQRDGPQKDLALTMKRRSPGTVLPLKTHELRVTYLRNACLARAESWKYLVISRNDPPKLAALTGVQTTGHKQTQPMGAEPTAAACHGWATSEK